MKKPIEPPPQGARRWRITVFCVVLVAFCVYRIFGYRTICRLPASDPPIPAVIGELKWTTCQGPRGVYDCGSIVVPKDYFDPTAGTARIALARYNATKFPRKGSVFFNPGGPGGSGVFVVAMNGKGLAIRVGDDWDIIGFDPRGIGETWPRVRCFPDTMAELLFTANTVIEQGLTVPSTANLSSEYLREQLILQYRQFLSLKESQALMCAKNMGDELKYMGTATVVRDIDFISQALEGKDTPINYYGGSYGSILGAYLVNMLPDRIGRVAIEAIADPVSWSNEPSHKWPMNWLTSTERTYELLLKACAEAGSSLCALSHATDKDWTEIERRLEDFFDRLAVAPLPVPFGVRPGYLNSGAARGVMLSFLDQPTSWPQGAAAFAEAMAGNGTALFNLYTRAYKVEDWPISYSRDLSRLAVACLDSPPPRSRKDFPTAEELADQGILTLKERSRHFGVSTGVTEPDGGCQFWPVRGPERFTGPFNASLKIPMLILSSTADPITPLSSAQRIHSLMANSSILVLQDSPGHGPSSLPGLCINKAMRGYFSGEMPSNGTLCQPDVQIFPTPGYEKAFSEEEQEILDAVAQVGRHFTRF